MNTPSVPILRGSSYVVDIMKTLSLLLVLGGLAAGLLVAFETHGSTRAVTAFSLIVGGMVSGSLWAWLGYVLEALMGIWLSTSGGDEVEEAALD